MARPKTSTKTVAKRPRVHERGRPAGAADAVPGSRWEWLTRGAFVLAVGTVLARATMQELLRDPTAAVPGAEGPPRGAGPAAALVLNLIACLPALLVLARRVFDRAYALRASWAAAVMGLLAAWALFSTFWAGDRFAAVVSASTFAAATALLWATAQLVRSWLRLRLVAGAAFGLLLVLVGHGFYQRFVEIPELRRNYEQNRQQILAERGLEPGSFAARQFEQKVLQGEMMGFSRSANTFAAVLVALVIISVGVAAQRLSDGDGIGWAIPILVALPLAGYVITLTDSKAAYATPVLGLALLGAAWFLRGWLGRHARLAYGLGLAAVLLGMAALVGHALYHDSLFHPSLTFRWLYWKGAAKLIALHPVLGVGWENFGPHYLGVRLPYPPEEIKDPHNLLVRFFAELGVVGGLLAVAWLLRMGWELTRPVVPGEGAPTRRYAAIQAVVAVAVVGVSLNALSSIDFDQMAAYVTMELIERVAGLILLVTGALVVVLRSSQDTSADDRPAPWVLYAVLVALGLFLLHNLVDFSLFETGALFLFALLAGAALGVRLPEAPARPANRVPAIALVTGTLVWLVAAGALAGPVVLAEELAHEADGMIRRARSGNDLVRASEELEGAFDLVPYNADYAYRRAAAVLGPATLPEWAPRAREALGAAIRANPYEASYYVTRAELESRQPAPDWGRVQSDFDRALELDPRNVRLRLRYAKVLEGAGLREPARRQYERALQENDLLPAVEPERLPPDQVEAVRRAISELGQPP